MSVSAGVIQKLGENREKRINGDIVAIPWSLKRLGEALPGIRQSHYTVVTANSKV